MSRRRFLRSYMNFIKEIQFKGSVWENLEVQQNAWWREQWDKIKKEFQVKDVKSFNPVLTIKIREKLEYGVRGWEQALKATYPMTAEERKLYRGYFLQSNQSKTNVEALQEVLGLLYQLDRYIKAAYDRFCERVKTTNAKQRMKIQARQAQKIRQQQERLGITAKTDISKKRRSKFKPPKRKPKRKFKEDNYDQKYLSSSDEHSLSSDSISSGSSCSQSEREQSEDRVLKGFKQQGKYYYEKSEEKFDEKYF